MDLAYLLNYTNLLKYLNQSDVDNLLKVCNIDLIKSLNHWYNNKNSYFMYDKDTRYIVEYLNKITYIKVYDTIFLKESNLSVIQYENVTKLWFNVNLSKYKKINLKEFTNLKELYCSNCFFKGKLIIDNNSNLEYIDCSKNKLTVSFDNLDKLKHINCTYNNMKGDLNNNSNVLKILICYGNLLKNINLKSKILEVLETDDFTMENIDTTKFKKLYRKVTITTNERKIPFRFITCL